jgi:hypothetical protein
MPLTVCSVMAESLIDKALLESTEIEVALPLLDEIVAARANHELLVMTGDGRPPSGSPRCTGGG